MNNDKIYRIVFLKLYSAAKGRDHSAEIEIRYYDS